MRAETVIAGRTPMPVRRAVRHARRARRSAFEIAGSDRYSALADHGMDRAVADLAGRGGTFIEAGANDGIRYSNTYLLERFYGWRGVLVEPLPDLARDARQNRPNATVVEAALIAPGGPRTVRLTDRDYSSTVDENGVIEARTRTLSSILDGLGIEQLDLLSLDVEGHEEQALAGLDFDRHAPRFLLVEVWHYAARAEQFEHEALHDLYEPARVFGDRDVLYALTG